jgi:hypothetical protein
MFKLVRKMFLLYAIFSTFRFNTQFFPESGKRFFASKISNSDSPHVFEGVSIRRLEIANIRVYEYMNFTFKSYLSLYFVPGHYAVFTLVEVSFLEFLEKKNFRSKIHGGELLGQPSYHLLPC